MQPYAPEAVGSCLASHKLEVVLLNVVVLEMDTGRQHLPTANSYRLFAACVSMMQQNLKVEIKIVFWRFTFWVYQICV